MPSNIARNPPQATGNMRGLVAAVLSIAFGIVALGIPAQEARSIDRLAKRPTDTLPMNFFLRYEATADSCSEKCRLLVVATGSITAQTPRQFALFAKAHDLTRATVVLNSEGGSVDGPSLWVVESGKSGSTLLSAERSTSKRNSRIPLEPSFHRMRTAILCAHSCSSPACTGRYLPTRASWFMAFGSVTAAKMRSLQVTRRVISRLFSATLGGLCNTPARWTDRWSFWNWHCGSRRGSLCIA